MTTREIYSKAVWMFKSACTANSNFHNEDPNTNAADVVAIAKRARKAYEWSQQNGFGKSFEYAANNYCNSGFCDESIQRREVYDAVIKGEGWIGESISK